MPQEKIISNGCLPCHRGEEPRIHGLLQAMVLLDVWENPCHGYELYRVLTAELPGELIPDRAVIYRMLRNLEKENYLSSRTVQGEGGPSRKVYAITPEGEGYLEQWSHFLSRRVDALNLFLRKYHNLDARTPKGEKTE